jgi:hypothetical protein
MLNLNGECQNNQNILIFFLKKKRKGKSEKLSVV